MNINRFTSNTEEKVKKVFCIIGLHQRHEHGEKLTGEELRIYLSHRAELIKSHEESRKKCSLCLTRLRGLKL